MNKLREFYDTLNKDIPFNELSVDNMDILDQSDAYKRYIKTNTKAMNKWLDNLKYIGNVLLCAFAAILLVIYTYWHVMNNM